MTKEKTNKLDKWDFQKRILLFLKLRNGKEITKKTISDFDKLIDKHWSNLKNSNSIEINKDDYKDHHIRLIAIKCLKSNFIKLEQGGAYKISDISNFSFYQDEKYRAEINGKVIEVSEDDFKLLNYILL